MTQEIIEKPMSAECTMKQYEAIPDTDFIENREYQLTDYPDNGANAEQMAYALTCQRLFPAGTVVTFSGTTDNTYTNGHLYQIQVDSSGTKSWKDITPVSEQSIPVLVGTEEKPITLDMFTDRKYYLVKGIIKVSENITRTVNKMMLCQAQTNPTVALYCFNYDPFSTNIGDNNFGINCLWVLYNNTGYYNIAVEGFNNSGMSNSNTKNPITLAFYAPTTSGAQGQILQSNGVNKAPTWVDNPAPRTISNTTVSNWVTDTTYSDFGYKADISITNLTENDTCEVIFNQTDASSGNYAQVNSSSAGVLTIYSKVNTEITIPTIIIIKGGN